MLYLMYQKKGATAMLEKLKEYFEREYRCTKIYLDSLLTNKKKELAVNITFCEMMGACTLIQIIDESLAFADVEAMYLEYKEKLEKLLD